VARDGLRRVAPRAIIYSSSHGALLQPHRTLPEAVWIDGPVAFMRPGIRNSPIRALERRRQPRLDLAMAMSVQDPVALVAPLNARKSTCLHVPVDASTSDEDLPQGIEPPYGVAYAASPHKKGLDIAIDAWTQAAPGIPLVVTGITRDAAVRYLRREPPADVRFAGVVTRDLQRAIVRRAAVYVSASRREEYGTSQLEALADEVPLAAVPSAGACEPVAVARRLQPNLVANEITAEGLASSVSAALGMDPATRASYQDKARSLMADYSYPAFLRRLNEDVLPTLLL
jgi:glycosyltransferase involved in cell wall biosynthesis